MNNLKRVLSLGLVGTMLAGMMAMGASAADFTDAADIEHSEAVNVLVALKVVDGKPDGSFDPNGNVTRSQMAKMIAVAMNGGNEANTGVKTTPTYTDIKGHWAESYIEYCASLGIISGRGDGTFDPDANVTGLEATKMVLTAMGFDAEAYKLTGASWAVRTDEVARTMTGQGYTIGGISYTEPGLYDDLATVMMASNATRDTAAQLIWNGLQNRTRTVQPTTTAAGGVEWTYVTNSTTLLQQRYSANTVEGTFVGNYDTDAASEEGFIKVDGNEFPYDFDIDNIGEEVKVIWRDGKGGTDGKPDKHDTIFGVFNTGKTQVYRLTKNDLQDADNAKKVKFGGTKYDTAGTTIEVTTNYMVKADPDEVTVTDISSTSGWRTQSPDRIKFVCDEDGKIVAAYVENVYVGRVTSATGSKITVTNLGTVDIADNDVAEDLKKDDVVTFTKFYDTKTADAFVTIEKAETVEGKVTGFKGTTPDYENLVVDGTTYKVANKTLTSVTASGAYTKAATGDEVRLYLCNGLVMAAEALSEAGGKYALVIDKDNGTVGSTLSGLKLIVMTPDGEEHTVSVDKDSTADNKATPTKLDAANIDIGDLIEYSTLANGKIKIKTVANSTNVANIDYAKTASISDSAKIWDETAKKLMLEATLTASPVANATAPLFVIVDDGKTAGTYEADDDFSVYTLRDLGEITNKLGKAADVYAYLDDGQVAAAVVELKKAPNSKSADTMYGLVKSVEGVREAPNGDDKTLYKVIVAGEIIDVYTDDTLAKGQLVTFKRTANDVYGDSAITKLVTADDTTVDSEWTLAAIVDNDSDLLKYYAATEAADGATAENPSYDGDVVSSAFDKDVTVIYVDADSYEVGDDVGYKVYDPANGYANALFHEEDGVIDVIFIETSGEANLAVVASDKDAGTDDFGPEIAAAPPADVAVTGATLSANTAELTTAAGTVDITVSSIEPANATNKTVTTEVPSASQALIQAAVEGTKITVKAADGKTLTNSDNTNATPINVTVKVGGVTVGTIAVTINLA